MPEYISPNDERLFGLTDSETIQNAIAKAKADGCRQVLIPRYNLRIGKKRMAYSCEHQIAQQFYHITYLQSRNLAIEWE